MAFDPNDLRSLAAVLGDALAPRVREAVAENVAVRLEALSVSIRADVEKQVNDVREHVVSIARDIADSTATMLRKEFTPQQISIETLDELKASVLGVEQKLEEKLEQAVKSIPDLSGVVENLTANLTAVEKRLDNMTGEIAIGLERVQKSIPEPAKPIEFWDVHGLTVEGRLFADTLIKEAIQPTISAVTGALEQTLREEVTSSIAAVNKSVQEELVAVREATAVQPKEAVDHSQIDHLRKHVEAASTQVLANVGNLEEQLVELRTQVTELQLRQVSTNASVEDRIEVLQGNLDALSKSTLVLTEEVVKHFDNLRSTVANIQTETEETKRTFDAASVSLDTRVSELGTKLEKTDAKFTDFNSGLNHFAGVCRELEAAQATLSKTVDGLPELIDGLHDRVNVGLATVATTAQAEAKKAVEETFAATLPELGVETKRLVAELQQAALPSVMQDVRTFVAESAVKNVEAIEEKVAAALVRAEATAQRSRDEAIAGAASVLDEYTPKLESIARSAGEAAATAAVPAAVEAMREGLTAGLSGAVAPLIEAKATTIAADAREAATRAAAQYAEQLFSSAKDADEALQSELAKVSEHLLTKADAEIVDAGLATLRESFATVDDAHRRTAESSLAALRVVETEVVALKSVIEDARETDSSARAEIVAQIDEARKEFAQKLDSTTSRISSFAATYSELFDRLEATKRANAASIEELDMLLRGHEHEQFAALERDVAKVNERIDSTAGLLDVAIAEAKEQAATVEARVKADHAALVANVDVLNTLFRQHDHGAEFAAIESSISKLKEQIDGNTSAAQTRETELKSKLNEQHTALTATVEELAVLLRQHGHPEFGAIKELSTLLRQHGHSEFEVSEMRAAKLSERIEKSEELITSITSITSDVKARTEELRTQFESAQGTTAESIKQLASLVREHEHPKLASSERVAVLIEEVADKVEVLHEKIAAAETLATSVEELSTLVREHNHDGKFALVGDISRIENNVASVDKRLAETVDWTTALLETESKRLSKELAERTAATVEQFKTATLSEVGSSMAALEKARREAEEKFLAESNEQREASEKLVNELRTQTDAVVEHCKTEIAVAAANVGTVETEVRKLIADTETQLARTQDDIISKVDTQAGKLLADMAETKASVKDELARFSADYRQQTTQLRSDLDEVLKTHLEDSTLQAQVRSELAIEAKLAAVEELTKQFAEQTAQATVQGMVAHVASEVKAAVLPLAEATALGVADGIAENALDEATKAAHAAAIEVAKQTLAEDLAVVESRMLVQLTDRLHREMDRLPKPKDGKDARVIAPVPYEAGKHYDAGAWVTSNHGVWVAARHTDEAPKAGSAHWDCVVPGIAAVEATMQEDGRTIELHFETSDGSFFCSPFRLHIPISKGLYQEGKKYEQDDMVTFDGGWWTAQRSGKLGRPGTDTKEWKLTVKRGRDGKDLKQPDPAVARLYGDYEYDKEYPANAIVKDAGVHWMSVRSTRERPPFATLVSNDTWIKLGS